MSSPVQALTFATALACGLVAGVFFAFSTFVMKALRQLPGTQGLIAMQQLNRTVITPLFMLALMGAALACAGLIVVALVQRPGGARWLIAGSAVYLVGTFGLTSAYHVPLNDRLAQVDAGAAGAAARWAAYAGDWTTWNHLRTAAALIAAALLTVALLTAD
jgi:uncharacterized membrane protein